MAGRHHTKRPRSGVEAEFLETARSQRLLRSRWALWMLLAVSFALSTASIVQTETSDPSSAAEVVMVAVGVAAAVGLISAGTLSLHGSRESRWDAPLTVGLGSLLLGIGLMSRILAATEAATDVSGSELAGVLWALDGLFWVGLCLIVGGLLWRPETGWSQRTRTALISAVLMVPVVVAGSWAVTQHDRNGVARGVLLLFAFLLVVASVRLMRHDPNASLLEGGTILGTGLALALVLEASSVAPGDIASIASLAWLVLAGLLTSIWFDRQAALRIASRQQQSERYLRLIEDSSHQIDQAMDDRSRLRHNGASSLVAIEGALSALEASSLNGDAASHERMVRVLTAEIGRLRRMLVAAGADAQQSSSVADALEPVIELARIQGQLVASDLPPSLRVRARPDTVAEIVHNLLDNAAIHAPGAVVAIEATEMPDGSVAVVIDDDGPGVPDGLRSTVFERTATSRTDGRGGVGLYSARTLARQAGGDLTLVGSGGGACFRLVLLGVADMGAAPLRLVPEDAAAVEA